MKFSQVVAQTMAWLQREGRVSYRALKLEFNLNDDVLDALKDELIDAKRLATDENGKVLVLVGTAEEGEKGKGAKGEKEVVSSQLSVLSPQHPTPNTQSPAAERRQLTVMFCDLVGSTALSTQLDPEDYRTVVQRYQQTCAQVIQRHEGYLAQYLGDGLLVYFGYPVAHEDDARRAVRTGLEIFAELPRLNDQIQATVGARRRRAPTDPALTPLLQVRIGIHTGLVVIGEIGGGSRHEQLALGETPNIAARVQGMANPDEVVISTTTYRLVEGLIECEDRGSPELKGISTPLTLYRVVKEGEAHSRFQVIARKGLTPLVGREHEYGLLQERWTQVKDGAGQVVLLSGEPGIGKSRLVEALKESLTQERTSCLELHYSPYHQNSALYPVIEHMQYRLGFQNSDSPEEKLEKLELALGRRNRTYGLSKNSKEQVIASVVKQSLPETEIASLPEFILPAPVPQAQVSVVEWSKGKSQKSKISDSRPPILNPKTQSEAEVCFLKAIDIAQKQQAKSWELRATASLARLWQQQGKRTKAHKLLSEVYNWFTEGFETKDLQETKALIEELSH